MEKDNIMRNIFLQDNLNSMPVVSPQSRLNLFDELNFRNWYAQHAQQHGLSPNPDDPEHYYDWRAAYLTGVNPSSSGHLPSNFKRIGHPRMFLGGVDTSDENTMGQDIFLNRLLGKPELDEY